MQKLHFRPWMPLVLASAWLVSGCQAAATQANSESVQLESEPPSLTTRAMAESFYEVLVAEMLGQAGDLASSYELLLRAAQTRQQEDLFQRASLAALEMGDGDRALHAALTWHQTLPQSREANKMVLQILIGLNQIPQTQWHLKQELRLTPTDEMEENLYAIPLIYQRAPDKQVVLQVVAAALEEQLKTGSPWRADALAALGRIRLQAGERERALDYLRQAHDVNPQSGGAGFLALELYAQGEARVGALLHGYGQSEEASPHFLLAYARLQIEQQQTGQALQTLKRLTARHPEQLPEAWLAKGALQAGEEDYDGARKSLDTFDKLLEPLPDTRLKQQGFDEANILRAQMADLEGDHDQAEHWLGLVQDVDAVMRMQLQRARILAQAGRLDEARQLIQSAPAPDEQTQRLKIHAEVQLLRDFGMYQQAYTLLETLVQADPENDDLVYEYALMAERLGRTQEMEKQLRALIARSPDHFHALNALGYSLADRGVRLGEARRLITQALSFEPDNPYITDSLGWLEYRSGNLPRARELLQKAYDTDPDAEIAAHLGEVLWQLRERDQARRIWQRAIHGDPQNASLRETIERLEGRNSPLLEVPTPAAEPASGAAP